MPATAVADRLARERPGWTVVDGWLERSFATHGWQATMLLAAAIGHIAEIAWHHPDLHLTFGRVRVRLQSHDVGGITERDFALAAKIDEVVLWSPRGSDGPLSGTPQGDPRFGYVRTDP